MRLRIWLEAGAIVTALTAIFGRNVDWSLAPYVLLVFVGVIAAVHVIYPNGGAK